MEETHCLTLRLPLILWRFAKKQAIYEETSLNNIIIQALKQYKKNLKKKRDKK